MTYVSQWESLSEAAERVMAATGLSQDEVRINICRAISDGARIRGKLATHAATQFTASDAVLERKDFHIPTEIAPGDLDWERSRPLKAWIVRRESFRPAGHWYLEWIELFRADVTSALCPAGSQAEAAQQALMEPEATRTHQAALESRAVPARAIRTASPQQAAAGPARPRGRRPARLERTKAAMRSDIQQGRYTVSVLREMLETTLATTYGVSRDTARKARNAVLLELGEN